MSQVKSSAALTSVFVVLVFRTAVFFRRLASLLAISNLKPSNAGGLASRFPTVKLCSSFRLSRLKGTS